MWSLLDSLLMVLFLYLVIDRLKGCNSLSRAPNPSSDCINIIKFFNKSSVSVVEDLL